MEPNWTALAAAIKKRRTELRFSQDGLAGEAKVSRSTIQKLEWGTARPEWKTLQLVEKALGWAPGSADDVLHDQAPTLASSEKRVDELGIGESAGDYTRREAAEPDLAVALDHIVLDLVAAVAPGTTIAEVKELQARALRTAERLGIKPRKRRVDEHNEDDPES